MPQDQGNGARWAHIWIDVGAVLFLIALAVSAAVVPQLRLLHFLQALIYVALVLLTRRDSAWGFGAGVTIAIAWNSLNLFITHLIQAGAREFWSFLHTGHARRLDTMMVSLGGLGHFLIIIGCLAAFLSLRPGAKPWWRFAGGGVAVMAYFALIAAVAAPR